MISGMSKNRDSIRIRGKCRFRLGNENGSELRLSSSTHSAGSLQSVHDISMPTTRGRHLNAEIQSTQKISMLKPLGVGQTRCRY